MRPIDPLEDYVPWVGPVDPPCTKATRKELARGALPTLSNALVSLFCRMELAIGKILTKLGRLIAICMMGRQNNRGSASLPEAKRAQ